MKTFAAMLAGAWVAGCATVVVPTPETVRFAYLHAPESAATVADNRPASERATREGRMAQMTYYYLGDTALQPNTLPLIAAAVTRAAPGKAVVLHRTEIGFWNTPRPVTAPSYGGGGVFIPGRGNPAAVAIGTLIGYGIIALVDAGGSVPQPSMRETPTNTFASATIELEVEGRRVAGRVNEPIFPTTKADEALEIAVAGALAQVVAELQVPDSGESPR